LVRHAPFIGEIFAVRLSIAMRTILLDIFCKQLDKKIITKACASRKVSTITGKRGVFQTMKRRRGENKKPLENASF
jgi:hypothetical protein